MLMDGMNADCFVFVHSILSFCCWKKDSLKTAAMDAIKKKMQAMKLEKDNAMDKADTLEQQNKEANIRAEKVNSTFAPN